MVKASVVNSNNIRGLIQRTLNCVDSRLVDHGKRVAYLVYRMLETDGRFTDKEKQDIFFLTLLHDVGAYKTEEINEMVRYESEDIWEHSIYGYLFLYHLSPLKDWAEAVLFHHVSADSLNRVDERTAMVSQFINLADRVDIFWLYRPDEAALREYLDKKKGLRFREEIVGLFFKTQESFHVLDEWTQKHALHKLLPEVRMSVDECEQYLRMLIFAIDFRSQHTVTHTITTTSIAEGIAGCMGMNEEQVHNIRYGALLHDLGKIGIPVEILEFPGKLSPQAMGIMKTHVSITEQILGGTIHPVITNIAVRHHEKLDGSGYPRGIRGEDMTVEEQVVAVADIVSALIGTRSYKKAYSKERTLSILNEQSEQGRLHSGIVMVLEENIDEILAGVEDNCAPILNTYYGLQAEYSDLLEKYHHQNVFTPA